MFTRDSLYETVWALVVCQMIVVWGARETLHELGDDD